MNTYDGYSSEEKLKLALDHADFAIKTAHNAITAALIAVAFAIPALIIAGLTILTAS